MDIERLIYDLKEVKEGWEEGNSDDAFELLIDIISELEIYQKREREENGLFDND